MRIKIDLSPGNLMHCSVVLLFFLTCLPVTMCLPGIIRNTLQIIAMLLFFIGLAFSHKQNLFLMFITVVAIMLIRVYFTWQYKQGFVSCAFNVYAGWAFAFYGFWIYRDNNSENRKKYRKLLILIFAIAIFTAITTIVGIQRYPLVVRELGRGTRAYSGASGDEFSRMKWEYRISNIAGWNQLYGLVYLVPIFLQAFRKSRKKILLIGVAIIEFCIIRSQLTFALLLSVVLIIFSFVKPSKNKNHLAVQMILLFAGLVAALNLDSIILLVVNLTSNKSMVMLSNKLYDLYLLMQGVNTGDSLARTNLYMLSIERFKEHPVLGQALYGVDSPYMFSYHSDFFDMMGYYGLFGLALVILGIFIYYRFMRTTNAPRWMTFVLFLGFLAMYVFNPIWYSPQISVGVFLLPAVLSQVFNLEENKGKEQGMML